MDDKGSLRHVPVWDSMQRASRLDGALGGQSHGNESTGAIIVHDGSLGAIGLEEVA